MSEKRIYNCDVCGKPIEEGHQKLYMVTVRLSGYEYKFDDGGVNWDEVYHVHNDLSNHCAAKIWKVLKKE